jgi:hypothetical protein
LVYRFLGIWRYSFNCTNQASWLKQRFSCLYGQCSVRIADWIYINLVEVSRSVPQTLEANAGIVPQFITQSLLSTFFQLHYSLQSGKKFTDSGPTCVWRSNPQIGRKNATRSSNLYFECKRWGVQI